ncbi:ras guanine-nucleotide exchange protein [Lichtheimia corymbifera JMRC:FSU:9682]|uniref:Ras guanine-nucleotide exchange protein n=1 Tax=Lichtheimia corymbifera JMRC:FSU:9682 TaxID=1263082 RepID=A0A068RP96_9FUNG|nr:ras guanine-nucleotide exchange protein [Lichtheimia corymbifera JMRC:FSU:9682]
MATTTTTQQHNTKPVSLSPPTSLPSSPRSVVEGPPSASTSHFVQALHDYQPSCAPTDESVSCLFFRKGAIIEVFNRDSSGWWDGVSNGVRGWFPSNYVGRIGEASMDYCSGEATINDDDNGVMVERENNENTASSLGIDGGDESLSAASSSTSSLSLSSKIQNQQRRSSLSSSSSTTQPPTTTTKTTAGAANKKPSSRVELARALLSEDRHKEKQQGQEQHQDTTATTTSKSDWGALRDEMERRIAELIDACQQKPPGNVQMATFHVVSSIRAMLTAACAVSNDAPLLKSYPELGRQRKIILSTLSRLVLKGKELQAAPELSSLAQQLLKEMDAFEQQLKKTPDSPIHSISNNNNTDSDASSNSSARLSSMSLIARAVPLDDARHILQTLQDHQTTIMRLMGDLRSTIDRFVKHEERATDMLETTRKAVEAVRTFLAVIEHVCSNVGDVDYGHHSVIPQDPQLVALVLAKESVYSVITSLVTCVRALAAGKPTHDDMRDLYKSCDTVTNTVNDSADRVRSCFMENRDILGTNQQDVDVGAMREKLESSLESRRNQTLSILGRKATSLNVLQDQYAQQQQNIVDSLEVAENNHRNSTNTTTSSIRSSISSINTTSTTEGGQQQMVRRARALSRASRSTLRLATITSEDQNAPPPVPPKNEIKPTSSKSTPMAPGRSHRPRGLSLSSLRMSASVTKQRSDSLSSSTETLAEPSPQIRRTSSWMTINGVGERRDSLPAFKAEHEPWFLRQREFSEDEIMYNNEGQVTGATVEALVDKLTQHEKSPELLFMRAFFYNFRQFTDPITFLDLLIKRFHLQPPSGDGAPLTPDDMALWTNRVLLPVRLRVYNVIKTWLESFFYYETDGPTEKTLVNFITGPMMQAMTSPAKRMMDLVRKRYTSRLSSGRKLSFSSEPRSLRKQPSGSHISLSSGTLLFSTLFEDGSNGPPNITRSLRNNLRKAMSQGVLSSIHISEFDPLELARQLTLMESALFCQIEPNEMIGQEFKKKVGCSTAVHVKAMIQRSTQITSWVSDTILRESDIKKRGQMIKLWIKVGDHCLQLRNYNTLMAIRSALVSTSIARLKRTWEFVSAKYKAMYDPIYRATDSQRNFAEYRRQLREAVAPCLPFLGVYLTDMTFIDDGNSNYRTSPGGCQLINFDKYIKTTRILNEIDQFQIPYKFTEVEEIQRYLVHCLETVEKDDQVFYTRSLQLEPREEDFDIKSFISNLA